MRHAWPLALLLLFPTASAHDGLGHLSVDVEDYPPGQTVSSTLDGGEEGPLKAGWVFALASIVEPPGRLEVSLVKGATVFDEFRWGAGATGFNTTRVVADGEFELRVRNPTNETVRAGYYFDMSCNCAAKTVPLPGGTVLFDYEFPAKRRVSIEVPVLENWTIEAVVATLPERGLNWPDDFETLLKANRSTPGNLRIDFQTQEAGTYYLVLTAAAGVPWPPRGPEDPSNVELTPFVDVAKAGSSPGPDLGAVALAVVGALVGARLRRSRRV